MIHPKNAPRVRRLLLVAVAGIASLAGLGFAGSQSGHQSKLAETAAKLERDGRKAEAIAVYEELARQDPLAKRVIARRLVRLYADAGNEDAALSWAEEVMKSHPDPEAYIAGIHSRCGNHVEAARILKKALEAKQIPRLREIMLRWQLADALDGQKKLAAAQEELRKALALSEGHAEEPTSRKRLRQFLEKREGVEGGE